MMTESMFQTVPVGDAAVLIICGSEISSVVHERVQWALETLRKHRSSVPVMHWVPSYTTILGAVNPREWSAEEVSTHIRLILQEGWTDVNPALVSSHHRLVEVPVLYGGDHGPDLVEISESRGMTADDFARMHAAQVYQVYLTGFVPGFPYLAGLPDQLVTPRKSVPRVRVPAGSVGIGGMQTGIYPASTPGGWQLIGRTPLRLFDLTRESVFLLKAGDHVRFKPIDRAAFEELDAHSREALPTSETAPSTPSGLGPIRHVSVIEPGMLTTVQDGGRFGYQSEGVSRAGVMDLYSMNVANLLVGNKPGSSVLETTLAGPKLEFNSEMVLCVTGGDCPVFVDEHAIPLWTAVKVQSGSVLSFGGRMNGCRNYIAIAGGFNVPYVMGSQSTDVGQKFGGYCGRGLQRGDIVPVSQPDGLGEPRIGLGLSHRIRPKYPSEISIGYIPSRSPSAVPEETRASFSSVTWVVSPQSNRMGIRLSGTPIQLPQTSVISEPVVPGSIQCPPSGEPIVLMSEAQTVGGYPTIGVVCTADLSRLAQAVPGIRLHFEPISEQEARIRLRKQTELLSWLGKY